jgi:FAD:protein FMN transferase
MTGPLVRALEDPGLSESDVNHADIRRFERRAMGSPLRLTVVDLDGRQSVDTTVQRGPGAADPIEMAWLAVSETFEAAEAAMSRFRESSDLTAINRLAGTGRSLPVDRHLVRALVAADRAGRLTGGMFDARVLGDLERLGYRGVPVDLAGSARLPDERSPGSPHLADPVEPVPGRRWLTIDVRSSRVAVRTPVDLGGIGKGLALRWGARSIERVGLEGSRFGMLLEAGGDLVGRAPAPSGGDWSIAIQDPAGGDEPKAVIRLQSGAIATSSVAINQWRDGRGRLVHHLIDPRSGEPGGDGLLAVTVAGTDPAWAEVWSKSLFLAGADGIAALARSRGLAGWWTRTDGALEMTPAARIRTLWSATD